ncbi:MAG TPA: pilus assembly protein TadG-related protein [Candidatus Dormibacteraeota bacterium]|nr:pilus assembly protein TadG-related protein [Candidatus Dormibacteraeota bacterium]
MKKAQTGQAVLLLAVMLVLLCAGAGLALDGGNAYLQGVALERAASAAALSGVPFMPGTSQAGSVDTINVLPAVKASARANGFVDNGSSVHITASTVTDSNGNFLPTQLEVTISETFPTFFMNLLGLPSTTVTRSETAAQRASVELGQAGYILGSTASNFGTPGSPYTNVIKGWMVDLEHGEPFNVDPCYEYLHTLSPPNCTANIHQLSGGFDKVLDSSPQRIPSIGVGNTNGQVETRGGYNFQFVVPPAPPSDPNRRGVLMVYNAVHGPDFGAANNRDNLPGGWGPAGPESFRDNTGGSGQVKGPPEGPLPEGDARTYSTVVYSLYVGSNPGSDELISEMVVHPIDADNSSNTNTYRALNRDGRGFSQITQTFLPGAGYHNMNVYHGWINPAAVSDQEITADTPIGSTDSVIQFKVIDPTYIQSDGSLAPNNTYRLRVDALNWDGSLPGNSPTADGQWQISYAIGVGTNGSPPQGPPDCVVAPATCAAISAPPTPAFNIHAINDMTIDVQGAHSVAFPVPIFHLGDDAAGQTAEIDAFDPGDVGATATMTLIPPYIMPRGVPGVTMYDVGETLGTQVPAGAPACHYAGGDQNTENVTNAPCVVPMAQRSGTDNLTVQTGGGGAPPYNGHWLKIVIPVPADYKPSAHPTTSGAINTTGYWSIQYAGGGKRDTLAIAAGLAGGPAHIVCTVSTC